VGVTLAVGLGSVFHPGKPG